MVIPIMNYSKILKTVDWGCFSIFIFGGIVVAFGFLLEIEINKTIVGLAVVFGWLAVAIATLIFIFDTVMWFIGKAPWYWKSLAPLNFSFVLLVVSLFRYNKEMGFAIPMVIVACSFVIAWVLSFYKVYDRKLFLLIIVPCFFNALGYYVPLLIGSLLLFVSILAKQGKVKSNNNQSHA